MLNAFDMVALPVFDQQGATSNISAAVPTTRTKLVPRKGVTDAWTDEMKDILASRKLTRITSEDGPPSRERLAAKVPSQVAALFL